MKHYGRVHCIGIGGIHVGAIAKLLAARGVDVSGSDVVEHDLVREMRAKGFRIAVGHAAENLPEGAEAVVYSHAATDDNPELVEARRRGIPVVDTHAFLALLFEEKDQMIVTGTHGKSTTTSMLGSALIAAGANPTVVVGTKVSSFEDGNVHVGSEDLLVAEGDEYRRHVLSYSPKVLVITNIEFDHPDAFENEDAYIGMFGEALSTVRDGGAVLYNTDDPTSARIIREANDSLAARNVRLIGVGMNDGGARFDEPRVEMGRWISELRIPGFDPITLRSRIPGEMNIRNAAMAAAAALSITGAGKSKEVEQAIAEFPGCWRRFEQIGLFQGAEVISDYGHHPTEISETLKAAKATYPDKRLVLCFQPHHRNRTRGLFDEFVPAFDLADVVLMSEIYDVPGRESAEDANISSSQLIDAIQKRDADFSRTRHVQFVGALTQTESALRSNVREGDILIMMGAGTIDGLARQIVSETAERVQLKWTV